MLVFFNRTSYELSLLGQREDNVLGGNVCGMFGIYLQKFHVGRSVHHHTIQINQPTRCNSFTSLLLDVLCCSTCFGRLHAHHQELKLH
jgi:hypothetical protein